MLLGFLDQPRTVKSILNSAASILKFEAMSGRLVYFRQSKRDQISEFVSLSAREYEDDITLLQGALKQNPK